MTSTNSNRKFRLGQAVRVRIDQTYRGGDAGVVAEFLVDKRYGVRFVEPGAHKGHVTADMNESELQTAAEFIADALSDGSKWRFSAGTVEGLGIRYKNETADDDGISFEDVMRRMGGQVDVAQHDEFPDVNVWIFGDGSAIAACGDGWDVRAAGCEYHCWAGAGCRCSE